MAGIAGLQYLFPTDFYYPKPSHNGETKTAGQEQIVDVQTHQELEEVNGNDGLQRIGRGLNHYATTDRKVIAISTASSSSKSLVPIFRRKQEDLDRMFLVYERFKKLEN